MGNPRYRLRFQLQEFDLRQGVTIIGRSPSCHVTIEDPLVSREHARIVIQGTDVTVEDLGSRNGIKVNGSRVREPTRLKANDRLRIGTQELVFTELIAPIGDGKTTGFLRHCAKCKIPYPQEVLACPNCGGTEQTDEETISKRFSLSSQHAWGLELLVEVIERAVAVGRYEEARRNVDTVTREIEARFASGGDAIDANQLARISSIVLKLAMNGGDAEGACWVAKAYRLGQMVPPPEIVDGLAQVARHAHTELARAIEAFVSYSKEGVADDTNPDNLDPDHALFSHLLQIERMGEAITGSG